MTLISSIQWGRKYTQSFSSAQVFCLLLTLHYFGWSKLSGTYWTTSRESTNLNSVARFKVLSTKYPSPLIATLISNRVISLRMLLPSTPPNYLAMLPSKFKTTLLLPKTPTNNRCKTNKWSNRWLTSSTSPSPSINSSIKCKCTMKTLVLAALTLR